jgi:MFS family permease
MEQYGAQRWRWLALALLATAQGVTTLDASVAYVALPSIGKDVGFSQHNLAWVINANVLAFGGFLLLGGRMADLSGRRRVFMAGLALFALGAVAAGLADSEAQLVAGRAAQGLGSALSVPAALSLVTTLFREGSERNRALGVWGAVGAWSGGIGVLLGGGLTDWLGWKWALLVEAPICLVAAAAAPTLLPESRPKSRTGGRDVAGAVSVTAGLSTLVYALVGAQDAGWGSAQTVGLLALAAGWIAAFVAIERRASAPLFPFRFFGVRAVLGANISGVLFGAALLSMFFLASLYMQQSLGFSPLGAGIALLPLWCATIGAATVAPILITRFGFKYVLIAGPLVATAGLVWFTQVPVAGACGADILGPSLLAGVGLGLTFVSVITAGVAGVAERESGLASGLINTSWQIGGALGIAIVATVQAARTDALVGGGADRPVALTEGFQAAFLAGAGIAAVGIVAVAVLIRAANRRRHAPATYADAATNKAA